MSKKPSYVFISYTSQDQPADPTGYSGKELAGMLHELLKENGIDSFMSDASMGNMGRGDFDRVIEEEIPRATSFVLVISDAKYNANWVAGEWRQYNVLLNQGEKEQGSLFCVYGDDPKQLRGWLSITEWFQFSPEGLNKLVAFLRRKYDVDGEQTYVCKNCGKPFCESQNGNRCWMHEQEPQVFEETGFDGKVHQYVYYPCCGMKIETKDGKIPADAKGCVSGCKISPHVRE